MSGSLSLSRQRGGKLFHRERRDETWFVTDEMFCFGALTSLYHCVRDGAMVKMC